MVVRPRRPLISTRLRVAYSADFKPSPGITFFAVVTTRRASFLNRGASLRGILPDSMVTVVAVQWYGSDALELTQWVVP